MVPTLGYAPSPRALQAHASTKLAWTAKLVPVYMTGGTLGQVSPPPPVRFTAGENVQNSLVPQEGNAPSSAEYKSAASLAMLLRRISQALLHAFPHPQHVAV